MFLMLFFCCCIKSWSSMALTGYFILTGVSIRLFLTLRSDFIVLICFLTVSTNDLLWSPNISIMAALLLKFCSDCSQVLWSLTNSHASNALSYSDCSYILMSFDLILNYTSNLRAVYELLFYGAGNQRDIFLVSLKVHCKTWCIKMIW